MLGRTFTITSGGKNLHALVLAAPRISPAPMQGEQDEYTIDFDRTAKPRQLVIGGSSPRAELYAAFRLLAEVGSEKPIPAHVAERSAAAIRWTDEWDNLDGSIERGYAGGSIYFAGGHVVKNLTRASEYARLLSSVGVNGVNVNNVNADLDLLTDEHLAEFKRLADVFRPWGVRLALSVDLTSPQAVGGLKSFDPLDAEVAAWWQQKTDDIYRLIPDFAGFTVKADSEGRKGPSSYGRSPADAANVLARALKPHGGVVLYRGFVYNHHLDWNDLKADRARAGVDNFARYDGQFDSNVVVQIKEGPIDFQAREAVSPLFAALRHTNVAIELQTAQEYTGQQRHMVWLPSMWQWVLQTDLRMQGRATPVSDVVVGRAYPAADASSRMGGFVSVTNVGLEANWLHHPMAMANLYGFARLAWNPDVDLKSVAEEWTRLTWGNDPKVVAVVDDLLMNSWRVYEGYTGPYGVGTLTNILGYHFGPGIESAERNGWGQWFRADGQGIGMDRTAKGTGYIQQYPAELAMKYESMESCPEDLLLFFHHVPYNHRMKSGKTLVQSIYDLHYDSAREAASYEPRWQALSGKIDVERHAEVAALFRFQAGHAAVWRDAINLWFERQSGIADEQGRVGRDANRMEAEAMHAIGYRVREVAPWETASGGKAMECREAAGCTLAATLHRAAGAYAITVAYYDQWSGASRFELKVNGTLVDAWRAHDQLPPAQFDADPDGQTAARHTIHNVQLKAGDQLELRGIPDLRTELIGAERMGDAGEQQRQQDAREYAVVDFIEVALEGAADLY